MKKRLIRKLLVLTSCAVLIFSFAACDSKNAADPAADSLLKYCNVSIKEGLTY